MPWVLRSVLATVAVVLVLLGLEFGLDSLTASGAQNWFTSILTDQAWQQVAFFAMVNVIVALSLNVINGMAGQFSIGHAGFVGIGAYTGALISSTLHARLHTEEILFKNSFMIVPPALIAGAIVAGLFGVIVGLPSLRLRGDYLAIVTLGFAEIFRIVLITAKTLNPDGGIMGGIASLGGAQGYAGPEGSGVAQYAGPFWIFGTVILATLAAWRIKFSGWGRALRALREDEIASAAVGVDPVRYKVTSFVIAAAGAGLAGALLAQMRNGNPTVQPDQFSFTYSFDAITMVILGGSGSVSGAVVGGVIVTVSVKLIEQLQRVDTLRTFMEAHPKFDPNALRMVVYAAILIGLMILRPEGLFGERELFAGRRAQAKKNAAAIKEASS